LHLLAAPHYSDSTTLTLIMARLQERRFEFNPMKKESDLLQIDFCKYQFGVFIFYNIKPHTVFIVFTTLQTKVTELRPAD
jgi:hypothetical protein